MRLTNTIRDAFVRSAMNDVPAPVDHNEAIRKIVVDDAVAQMPPAVQRIWQDHSTRPYVKTSTCHVGGISVTVPTHHGYSRDYVPTSAAREAAERLHKEQLEQVKARSVLEEKLRSVAISVTTRKALAEALPEFEKYLPEDEAKAIRTLPAIANVVADFVKAGWPKDKGAA